LIIKRISKPSIKSVVHYYKNAQSEWVIGEILTNEEDVLILKNLDIQMPLKDIYEGILMK
jgi:hypothetical protein